MVKIATLQKRLGAIVILVLVGQHVFIIFVQVIVIVCICMIYLYKETLIRKVCSLLQLMFLIQYS